MKASSGRLSRVQRDGEIWYRRVLKGEPRLELRVEKDPGGRWHIVEVRLLARGGVAATDLRNIALGQLEAEVASRETAAELGRELGRRAVWPVLEPFVVDIPPRGRRYPDEFYSVVADVYRWTASVRPDPAAWLAASNNVPVTTVHGWIKEARKRGFLPRHGRKGRTG